MKEYLLICWPTTGQALSEVRTNVELLRLLIGSGETADDAFRLLDRVDKERYVEMSPRLWLWELHRA